MKIVSGVKNCSKNVLNVSTYQSNQFFEQFFFQVQRGHFL
jgi:hypothetical protein